MRHSTCIRGLWETLEPHRPTDTDAHASDQLDETFSSDARSHPLRNMVDDSLLATSGPSNLCRGRHGAYPSGSISTFRTSNSLGADMYILPRLTLSALSISTALLTVSACDRLGSHDPVEARSGGQTSSATPDPSPTPTTTLQLSKLMRSKLSELGTATVRLTGYEDRKWSSTYRIDCRSDKLRLEFHRVAPGRAGQPAKLHFDIIIDGNHFYSRISNWRDPGSKRWHYGKIQELYEKEFYGSKDPPLSDPFSMKIISCDQPSAMLAASKHIRSIRKGPNFFRGSISTTRAASISTGNTKEFYQHVSNIGASKMLFTVWTDPHLAPKKYRMDMANNPNVEPVKYEVNFSNWRNDPISLPPQSQVQH